MLYFIYRIDKPGTSALREATRPAHLEWAKTLGSLLVFAGPTLAEDETTMIGSVWILEASSREEADAVTRGDPYEQAGLFQSKEVHAFLQVVPGLMGAGPDH